VPLLEGKKLWEGKPFVHHFKTDTYRDAYMHCLEIIAYEITEHVYPAIPEIHHDNRITPISAAQNRSTFWVF
jgi:hypothetical protein